MDCDLLFMSVIAISVVVTWRAQWFLLSTPIAQAPSLAGCMFRCAAAVLHPWRPWHPCLLSHMEVHQHMYLVPTLVSPEINQNFPPAFSRSRICLYSETMIRSGLESPTFVAGEIGYTLPYISSSEMPLTDRLCVINKSCTPTGRARAPALRHAGAGNPVVKHQHSNSKSNF